MDFTRRTNGDAIKSGMKHAEFLFQLFDNAEMSEAGKKTKEVENYLKALPNFAEVHLEIKALIEMLTQMNVAIQAITLMIVVEKMNNAKNN